MYEIFEKLLAIKDVKTADVVKATGVSHSTFGDWKSGRSTPKPDKMKKIADYFDVPLEYLLTGEMPSYSPEGARIAAESMFNPRLSAINEMFLELSPERQADIYNYAKMIYDNEKGK